MGECLVTTRGEKGATGPKGDPGAPTLSSVSSILGATLVRSNVTCNQRIALPAYQGFQTQALQINSFSDGKSTLITTTHPILVIHSCTLKFERLGSNGFINFSFEAQHYDGISLRNGCGSWSTTTTVSFQNKCIVPSTEPYVYIGFYGYTGYCAGNYFTINMTFSEFSASNNQSLLD